MGRSTADMFCKHIHYLAEKSVDLGCDPGRYCPPDRLTRLPMASFVAKALVQPGGDAAVPLLTDRVLLNRTTSPATRWRSSSSTRSSGRCTDRSEAGN